MKAENLKYTAHPQADQQDGDCYFPHDSVGQHLFQVAWLISASFKLIGSSHFLATWLVWLPENDFQKSWLFTLRKERA